MTTYTNDLVLPLDLAPSLVQRRRQLLAEVPTTTAPALVIDLTYRGPRCVVCHLGGKLGGHHGDDGRVEWIHGKWHRRLHRRGSGAGEPRVLTRRRRTAC